MTFSTGWGRPSSRPSRPWTRWSAGPLPIRTRNAWWGTIGSARRTWPRTPAIAAEIRKTVADVKAFAAGVHGGAIRPPTAARFTQVLSIGIGGSALGPDVRSRRPGQPRSRPLDRSILSTTRIRTASPAPWPCWPADWAKRSRSLPPRAVARRTHATACCWWPRPIARRAWSSPGTRWPSHAGLADGSYRRGARLAGSLPHVRLDRRTHQRAVGGRPGARSPARARHRRFARRRRGLRRGYPPARHASTTRPPSWP